MALDICHSDQDRSFSHNLIHVRRMNSKQLLVGMVTMILLPSLSNSSELSKTRDCTVIELEPEIDPNLTTQENIQRLTEQFFESVNTVQHCEPPSETASSGAGGGATASSDLSGSEAVLSDSPKASAESVGDSELSAIQQDIEKALSDSSNTSSENDSGSAVAEAKDGNNGALPDDIPSADNDSVFEAQIRAAAENETDPDVRKNLWNEYRKYKGLPIKE